MSSPTAGTTTASRRRRPRSSSYRAVPTPTSGSTARPTSGCGRTATALHPTPIQFTSPTTGPGYRSNYERAALEADLPRIESPPAGNNCDRTTGAGCTLIPLDDEGQPAAFYPYFTNAVSQDHRDGFSGHGFGEHSQCVWQFGTSIRGVTTNDFGKNAGYGSLLANPYLIFGGGGASHLVINDFRNVFSHNPCPAPGGTTTDRRLNHRTGFQGRRRARRPGDLDAPGRRGRTIVERRDYRDSACIVRRSGARSFHRVWGS